MKPTDRILFATILLLAFALMPAFQSCFTGVEGTGKINLSKKDISVTAPTQEEKYLSDISFPVVGEWRPGLPFFVSDDKLRLLVENPANVSLQAGDTLYFSEVQARMGADGGETSNFIFEKNGANIFYPVEKPLKDTRNSLTASDLAMLIDLDMVEKVKAKLLGRTLWTKSALWYDDNMKYQKGSKFAKVTVVDVLPGNSFFPLMVAFRDDDGRNGRLLMNFGTSGNESRSFSRLFFLNDPRSNYKHISDENWSAIQAEQLRPGMTKEEVRLSRGNPSDVNTGHDYSNTLEIWYYPDGSFVRFIDGLVVNYK